MAKAPNPMPLQFPVMRKEQFATDSGVSFFNLQMAQVVDAINQITGQRGPAVLPAGIDVAGGKITGLGAPTSPTDAISAGHAESKYSPTATAPALDIGGKNSLKGLSAVYGIVQPGIGVSGTLTLAPLTSGGSTGSITIQNGIIVKFEAPS